MKRSALIVEFATLKRSFHSLEGASAPVLFVRLLLLVVQALMADGAVAPVDARMRVQDVWSGATTREPRRESQLTYPVGNSCGICGYMYVDRCCVLLLLSGAMHGVSCSVALLLSRLAAFGPLSTRYGFPSGNSLTAPIDASATVTPVSCEVLLTCCVVHDYMYMY